MDGRQPSVNGGDRTFGPHGHVLSAEGCQRACQEVRLGHGVIRYEVQNPRESRILPEDHGRAELGEVERREAVPQVIGVARDLASTRLGERPTEEGASRWLFGADDRTADVQHVWRPGLSQALGPPVDVVRIGLGRLVVRSLASCKHPVGREVDHSLPPCRCGSQAVREQGIHGHRLGHGSRIVFIDAPRQTSHRVDDPLATSGRQELIERVGLHDKRKVAFLCPARRRDRIETGIGSEHVRQHRPEHPAGAQHQDSRHRDDRQSPSRLPLPTGCSGRTWLCSPTVGEGADRSLSIVTDRAGGSILAPDLDIDSTVDETVAVPAEDGHLTAVARGRRRFVWASVIGVALPSIPFTWILWSLWGPVNPLRKSAYEDNFFDLQARAMFHGHLSLPPGNLGIEGFIHDGRTYTYFGLFPSVIRMPILLMTSSLDGKLTPSYMLCAWFLTGLFLSLLLWRVRYLMRGDAVMGRGEAAGYGVLVATCMGGTIWMLLASIPYVFDEDIAWSICLTLGSLFALLGVLERPTWGRVVASGVLILCANLDRQTTGWACVVGAGLVALWFLLGFGGQDNRRWFGPVLAAGVLPIVVSCAVNFAKFGVPFGVPITDQVYTHVNAYRRRFLAANHNSEVGTSFILTNLVAYLRPDGLSLSSVFPFVTLPTGPPNPINGVLFDRLYRTSSVPSSTPLLFLLSLWGLVTAFRPRALGRVSLLRPLLLAAGSAAAALLLWGYIAPRYIGDFVPFLVLASSVAIADVFRRLEKRSRVQRLGVLSAITLLALFSIVANLGMAIVPNEEWNTAQVLSYVNAQKSVSDVTGHPIDSRVQHGNALPIWGPAGQLFVVGRCDGLYISTGEKYWTVPAQQADRTTWRTVELGGKFQHGFTATFDSDQVGTAGQASLVTSGPYTVTLTAQQTAPRWARWGFKVQGGGQTILGPPFAEPTNSSHTVVVTTDPAKHQFIATVDGIQRLLTSSVSPDGGSIHVTSSPATGPLHVKPVPTPSPALCESLVH